MSLRGSVGSVTWMVSDVITGLGVPVPLKSSQLQVTGIKIHWLKVEFGESIKTVSQIFCNFTFQ